MPIVEIKMWKGRTAEQKEKLIKDITKAFEDIGIAKERTTIIIHDIPKENWGTAGEQSSKRQG